MYIPIATRLGSLPELSYADMMHVVRSIDSPRGSLDAPLNLAFVRDGDGQISCWLGHNGSLWGTDCHLRESIQMWRSIAETGQGQVAAELYTVKFTPDGEHTVLTLIGAKVGVILFATLRMSDLRSTLSCVLSSPT